MITVSLVKCVLNSPKTTPVILHSLKYDSRHYATQQQKQQQHSTTCIIILYIP